MEPRRVFVLGAGAIGAAVGALLFEAGVDVILVVRGENGRAIAERGVDLRFPEEARTITVPTAPSLAATTDDLVILATMGHDTSTAIATLDPRVPIASFQNGDGPLDVIMRRGHPTIAAMVYVPAERRGPGVIALPGAPVPGSIVVGSWPTGAGLASAWLVERLRAATFRAELEADIAPWIRAKLLVNLAGVVVALCDDPPSDVIDAAREEARAVWRACGKPFEEISTLLARVGPLESMPVDGRERVGGSTRSALARGDRLETASLHGTIVEEGRATSTPTPVNERLVALAEEAGRERWVAGAMTAAALRERALK